MTNDLEGQVINLVATDRFYIPSSSFDGKLENRRKKIAKEIEFEGEFQNDRVYARVEEDDRSKARGMREGIAQFAKQFPKYGTILNGMIEEERTVRETHLYFGVNEGKRLTRDDYIGVLLDMKLTPAIAERYCDVALDISRTMSRKRDEKERSVLIG